MRLPPITCPYCGREFANYAYLERHIGKCAAKKQRALDREYEQRNAPEGAVLDPGEPESSIERDRRNP